MSSQAFQGHLGADGQYATPEMTDLPDMGQPPQPKDAESTPAAKVSYFKSSYVR